MKPLLDYTNLFSPKDYRKNNKVYIGTLKKNREEESVSLYFRLTRNYLLDK